MKFSATVKREVDNQISEWQNAVLASVLLLSHQDATFKQTLLTALQDDTIEKPEDMEDKH